MANTVIQLKHSTTLGATPSSLANGELAINNYDGKMFYRDPNGTIQTIQRFTGPAGLNKEIQFNDSGTLGANASLTFDKANALLNVGGNTVWHSGNDGSGSGLDADLLDGLNSSSFANTDHLISAYNFANTVNIKVDSAFSFANTVNVRTQSSYDFANTVNVRTQSSYDFGNTVNVRVQSSYDFANTVNVRTQSAYNFANTVNVRTQSAYDFGNTVNVKVQSSYDFANTVNVRTQAAFDKANTGTTSTSSNYVRKTTTYTANVGDRIIADTSGGAFTITLPLSPQTGNSVVFVDGSDWSVNNLTVARNGATIEGLAENLVMDIQSIRVDLVYDGTTWQVYAAVAGSYIGYSTNIGDGTNTSFTLTHNLNSTDVHAIVKENSTGYLVYPDIKQVSNTVVTLEFYSAPSANQYKAIVIGIES